MLSSSAPHAAELSPLRSLLRQYIKHQGCKREALFINTMCGVKRGCNSRRATLKHSPKPLILLLLVISAGDQVGTP